MSEQMYKCPCCGAETDRLPTVVELFGNFSREITNYTCRGCGKEDYDTASKCKVCGEWTCDTELHDNLDVCAKCAESLKTYFKAFKSKLTDNEWGFMVDYMDEENLI